MAEQPNSNSSPLGTEHQHTGQKFIDALSSALPHLAPHEVGCDISSCGAL